MRVLLRFYGVGLFFLFASCVSEDAEKDINPNPEFAYRWDLHEPFVAVYNTFSMPVSAQWDPIPEAMGPVAVSEASGIAWSYTNPGKIWTHNDSGNTNVLFLLDSKTGEVLTTYRIGGTVNIDWEDIEVSYGPEEGQTYIYLSDSGDNDEKRGNYNLYRFPEPTYEQDHFGKTVSLNELEIEKITFQFPDGSHDTEGMMVDPLTLDIYFATKRDIVSILYVAPYPQKTDGQITLIKAGEFGFRQTSAATSSISGNRVLIKNRQEIFYWERNEGESMVEMLARTPVKAPYLGEPQGEAICFDPEDNYFTLSEQVSSTMRPLLYKYNIK